jgi:hypothetical protein
MTHINPSMMVRRTEPAPYEGERMCGAVGQSSFEA